MCVVCAWVCVCACTCAGGVRFSNSNRIIPSDYRILLLLKMPIPSAHTVYNVSLIIKYVFIVHYVYGVYVCVFCTLSSVQSVNMYCPYVNCCCFFALSGARS